MPIDKNIIQTGRQKPLILISNDDGIYSEGLSVLRHSLKNIGRVVVVAPDRERSAISHALTLHTPLRIKKVSCDVYSADGTPADCINIAVNGILKEKPDLVVAGINHGGNLGADIHYSGTVAAALEGGIMGIPSIAISVAAKKDIVLDGAKKFAAKIVKIVLKKGLPDSIILNVNLPNVEYSKIKGCVVTSQGRLLHKDMIIEKEDPRKMKYFWIGGHESEFQNIPESDCSVIAENKISITPINVDTTAKEFLAEIRSWRI